VNEFVPFVLSICEQTRSNENPEDSGCSLVNGLVTAHKQLSKSLARYETVISLQFHYLLFSFILMIGMHQSLNIDMVQVKNEHMHVHVNIGSYIIVTAYYLPVHVRPEYFPLHLHLKPRNVVSHSPRF